MILKIWKTCFVFALVTSILCSTQEIARAKTSLSNEAYALDMVNRMRNNPLAYAEQLGYNRALLLEQQPWLSGITQGLGVVAYSYSLTTQASIQNAEDYSASGSEILYLDDAGTAVSKAVTTMNIEYAAEGTVSGIVSFYNLMDAQTAIGLVINNQFKNELDASYEGKRILLSPQFRQMGTAIRAGQLQVDSRHNNAFFVYTCFSSSLLKSEVQVINMLNQVRAYPDQAETYLSFNLDFLPGGYTPLFFNDALISASQTVLHNEVDVHAHALYFGFPQPDVGYTNVLERFPSADSNTLARWIFSSLMVREVAAYPTRDAIFNPAWNEIGPALYAVGNNSYNSIKLTMVSGYDYKEDTGLSRIYGVVYTDSDSNGAYTPGEDASDLLISVYDNRTGLKVRTIYTNKAGQFSLTLPNNVEYNIETINKGKRSGQLLVLTKDQFLELIVEAQ
ncbi:MAG: hypothetical protein FP812_13450 [Desulfobacula sp.]|nr:hypothetical protein [Desulfobacula sp.]